MKRYETIVIIDPDLSKEAETPIFERVNDLIPQYKGFLIETDDWGTKKLAYDIKKKNRGHYVRLDFCGDGALIQEMERFFRIDDNVLKFMTVLLDEDADLATKRSKPAWRRKQRLKSRRRPKRLKNR
jgi:small subunit ribosomal protein S6